MRYTEGMPTTSMRFSPELLEALDHLAAERQTTRSDLVREAVEKFVAEARARGPADRLTLLRSLVTYPGSGKGDLAANNKAHLAKLFRDRRGDRPR